MSLQVKLPIDPGVVLLDIGFTGDDPNHGEYMTATGKLEAVMRQMMYLGGLV